MKHNSYDRRSKEKINRLQSKIIIILIPLISILIFWQRNRIIYIGSLLPPCLINTVFNIYCPACGNTRSVTALLKGDILTSLRYNIIPFLLLSLGISAYIELVTYSFGKRIHILSRKPLFYILLGLFVVAYLIIRNFV
ncbi:MAG: DUF2752 domain-containing protein [Clostridiales bacterium]|nr:DUF2752 domain-containing protein [Clostridiales bacterium]